jgi:hypothetical protein
MRTVNCPITLLKQSKKTKFLPHREKFTTMKHPILPNGWSPRRRQIDTNITVRKQEPPLNIFAQDIVTLHPNVSAS